MALRLPRALARASLLAIALAGACGRDDRVAQPLGPTEPGGNKSSQPVDPTDVGAGYVDSPPLPPLFDRGAAYDPADLGPIDIHLTVDDERAFAAVEADH